MKELTKRQKILACVGFVTIKSIALMCDVHRAYVIAVLTQEGLLDKAY